MSDADQLLKAGDLDGARAALVETVRSKPSDQGARMYLFQLLAIAGEWDKARKQLATLAQLSPEAQMLSIAYGQAIEAEAARARVFAGEELAPLLVDAEWARPIPLAIQAFAIGRDAEGEAARDAAFDAAPEMAGEIDGVAFDWIADADSRFGPTFEAIIGGRYGLVPFDAVESMKSEGPRDLRDIIWYPVEISFKSGQSIAAMLPARYPGSEASDDTAERLTRTTGWRDTSWGQAGSGQHIWALSNGEDRDLLSVRLLTLA
ncbi:type VI secretion system accessory protein TagJ [Sphingomonas sp.]|uniref:type VI secretion system accessory protein TagJ n=1 Tax=Sphingomonas sp. TaxID=28214 RepID=UPI002DD62BDF|nr:type VI secretion system accessory protein TagJ [Sphingomonas sp.]